eukprot:TRINITY_DN9049_c0_g6_i3.p1 TRINITY_DN9049_c0_g6~~TRINITY_DN9049_c0_g6_i3.p1  ORF type:complete len:392 (+),score=25.87 TRINITY_DN9049_c0_g6_i3:36-1178(+)
MASEVYYKLPISTGSTDAVASPQRGVKLATTGRCALLEADGEKNDSLSLSSRALFYTAVLGLVFVTIIWGAQHATIKIILRPNGDSTLLRSAMLLFLRFSLAAICFLPWLPRASRRDALSDDLLDREGDASLPYTEWKAGLELGCLQLCGFSLAAVGVVYTSAQRNCLLLYLNVKLVPLFCWMFFGRQIDAMTWLSVIVAFMGTALLIMDGPSNGVPPNVGDALSVLAAVSSAFFMIRLEHYAPVTRSLQMNCACMIVVAVGSLCLIAVCALISAPTYSAGLNHIWIQCDEMLTFYFKWIVFLGVIVTAFTSWIQTLAQRYVKAEFAAMLYALDPLWGCLFAYLWLGETLGRMGFLGACLLLSAIGGQLANHAFKAGARA